MKSRSFFCVLGLLLGASVHAQQLPEIEALWKDPGFQKQFVGGYGINPDVEPRVTADEVEILEKLRPLMGDNKLAEAEKLLKEEIQPESSAILDFTLGSIQFQQERMADALDNYDKAVRKFPSFKRAWRNLGLIQTRSGKFDKAIEAFTEMIKLGGGDAYAYGLLGYAHAARQDFQPAEAAYRQALLLQPENTEWRLGLTRCVFKQEKFEDAATLLDALLARYPDKADFWLLQAQTFLGMKRPLRAAENLEMIDRLGKATLDSQYTLGDVYVSEGLLDLGVRAYQRALELDPKQSMARSIRAAEVLAARGAADTARRLIAIIRKTGGDQLEAKDRSKVLKLDSRLSMADGTSNAETVAVLDEIVKLDPLDGEALMLLGQHYSKQNEPDRAIFYYERAAGIEVFEANAKVRQAQVLVRMSRYGEALPLLRRAQEVKPREDVARYLEQVERLAKSKK